MTEYLTRDTLKLPGGVGIIAGIVPGTPVPGMYSCISFDRYRGGDRNSLSKLRLIFARAARLVDPLK